MMKALAISVKKLRAMCGGCVMAAAVFVCAALMFFAARDAIGTKGNQKLVIAVIDNAASAESKAYIDMLEGMNSGAEVILCADKTAAEKLEKSGVAEGTLMIDNDFAEKLTSGESALNYTPAKGVSSSEAARELIAGTAVVLKARLNAPDYFSSLNGAASNADERARIDEAFIKHISDEDLPLEVSRIGSGVAASTVLGAFAPRYAGFCAFVMMLIVLMLGVFTGSDDARAVRMRMGSVEAGRAVDLAADLIALMLLGGAVFALSLIIKCERITVYSVICGFTYLLAASSLALLIGSCSSSARTEIAVPLTAFITSLAGGCFADLSSIETMKRLALFTPQGQYLDALNGSAASLAILAVFALLMLALSALIRFETVLRARIRKRRG
ncbi:MAG: ABC transporter permease [Clostridia bacterium]|nr:ABC transporter permease [Clostridia bacterium]